MRQIYPAYAGSKLPPNGGNVQGFNRTPWNATSRTTAQGALWQHILNRNTSNQPFMTPCTRQVMNRIPGNVTPPWAGCWGPAHTQWARQYTYQHRETDEQQGRPPRPKPPPSTQRSEPPREKGGPLTCSPYKRSGGSSGFSLPGPAFSLQREYLSVVARGGDLVGVAGPDFRG